MLRWPSIIATALAYRNLVLVAFPMSLGYYLSLVISSTTYKPLSASSGLLMLPSDYVLCLCGNLSQLLLPFDYAAAISVHRHCWSEISE